MAGGDYGGAAGTLLTPDVRFARPDPAAIRAGGLFAADLHFHTVHTDGTVTIPSLLRHLRKNGHGCAVTDHNEVAGAVIACRERDGLLVIPGIEISTCDGPHILLYFYSSGDLADFFTRHIQERRRESPWMLTTITSGEVLDAAEGYACLRGAAHPYGYAFFDGGLGKCVEKGLLDASLYRKCDLIEGICANMARRENRKAVALADRLHLPVTGGSDGHVLSDCGSSVTCTASEDPGEFLDELRRGKATVIGTENPLIKKVLTAAVISARFLPYLLPSVKIHCESLCSRTNRFLRGGRKERQ